MFTISTRRATADELQIIRLEARADPASWGCLTLVFGVAWPCGLAFAGRWIGGFFGDEATTVGLVTGIVVGLSAFAYAAVTYYRFERDKRRRGRGDVEEMTVQEVRVINPRVVELSMVTNIEPILCFDVGEQMVLLLQGHWIRDPEVYGEEPSDTDPDENTINGLGGKNAFPSTDSTVTRLPHSRRVLSIRTAGDYLPPERLVDALKPEFDFGDSEILDGDLSQLEDALERAHRQLKTAR